MSMSLAVGQCLGDSNAAEVEQLSHVHEEQRYTIQCPYRGCLVHHIPSHLQGTLV